MALTAMILGCSSILCAIVTGICMFVSPIVGVIFGILAFLTGAAGAALGALSFKTADQNQKMMAVVGLATGVLGFTLGMILFSQSIVWNCDSCLMACR